MKNTGEKSAFRGGSSDPETDRFVADWDEETASWCIFVRGRNFAFSSFSSKEEAEWICKGMNAAQEVRNTSVKKGK